MARPPITPERMLGEASTAQLIYRSEQVHPRHQANFRVFDPLDFLAEVSAHIPDAHEKTTLFYGWYSNRRRGYRKQHGLLGDADVGVPPGENRAPLDIRRSWARLIRQVYEADPRCYPECGGAMRIIAFIDRPAVIEKIISHLGLPSGGSSLRPPDQINGLAGDQPLEWSYDRLFDDLPIPDSAIA
jgi:hypothetical protein